LFLIILFTKNSFYHNRDQLINEGMVVANNAREYFHKPATYGGGQYTFTGWEIPSQMVHSANGSYTANVGANTVEIIGTGNELVSGTDSVKVKFTVTGTGIQTMIIN
jgi:hypothetical protein